MKNLTHVEFDLIFTSVGIIKKLRQTEMNSTTITELVSSRAGIKNIMLCTRIYLTELNYDCCS